MFKDLKQILRKEQCDGSIMLTANVPSTKKVVVHGPQGNKNKTFLLDHEYTCNNYIDNIETLIFSVKKVKIII